MGSALLLPVMDLTVEKFVRVYVTFVVALRINQEIMCRMCQNRMLRKIFGPKREEVTEHWTKLRIEGFLDLNSTRC